MTLGEELCKKYALTSFRNGGCSLVILAINEALEAAMLAEEQQQVECRSPYSQFEVVSSREYSPSCVVRGER